MEIYFDESRNTGELGFNGKTLNYDNQRYFVLVGFCDNRSIINKYKEFKDKWIYNINENKSSNVIKGNHLLKKENMEAVQDLINNVAKGDDFFVTVYDKKYFLISQMVNWLFPGLRDNYEVQYHSFVECLIKVDESLIAKYINVTKYNTIENIADFKYELINHGYNECIRNDTEYRIINEWKKYIEVLSKDQETYFDSLKRNNVENIFIKGKNRNNIVNLTALGETILLLKHENSNLTNKKLYIYHDQIELVEDYIKHYLNTSNISFINDSSSIQVQLADNLASIIGKLINEILPFNNDRDIKTLLSKDKAWIRNYMSQLLTQINNHHIKLVITMREQALIKTYITENKTWIPGKL